MLESGNPAPSVANNPFAGIISDAMHRTFTNAIDAMLMDCACTTPCTLVFPSCETLDCPNCSEGTYKPGGPAYFARGRVCPICHNIKETVPVEDELSLLLIFDFRKWSVLNKPGSAYFDVGQVGTSQMFMESMSRIETYNRLKSCKHIVADACNGCTHRRLFERCGEPEPCGFGKMEYIITPWRAI